MVVVALAAFFAQQSYSNIGVQDNPKVTTKNVDKTPKNRQSKSKKHHSKKRNNDSKKDQNILLQDANNPDRVIAIHPYDSNGIYQYRAQANGSLYPEYKYFNGNVVRQGNKLIVTPVNNASSKKSFTFVKGNDGTYREANSGQTYRPMNTSEPTNSSNDHLTAQDPISGVMKDVLDNTSNPTQNANGTATGKNEFRVPFPLSNGSYFDMVNKFFYGPNSEDLNMTEFKNNPSKYLNEDSPADYMANEMMYYKQNYQTEISQKEIDEDIYWNDAMDKYMQSSDYDPVNTVKPNFNNSETSSDTTSQQQYPDDQKRAPIHE